MTSSATDTAGSDMAGMIEFHVKAAQPWKRFQRSSLRVAVTDGADRIR
jgi:hypothetical protein